MLPKIYRLTKKKDFQIVFQKGKSIKSGFLVFKILKNHFIKSRFGFIVSKKISTKATVRNKIKRRIRDSIFTHVKKINIPIDVVVITLPGIEKKEFSDIEGAVAEFFKKIT